MIYIVPHKPEKLPELPGYVPIQVGGVGVEMRFFIARRSLWTGLRSEAMPASSKNPPPAIGMMSLIAVPLLSPKAMFEDQAPWRSRWT